MRRALQPEKQHGEKEESKRMKKALGIWLAACLLVIATAAYAEEEGHAYYGVANWIPERAEALPLSEEETARVFYVSFVGSVMVPVVMPEGSLDGEMEDYHYTGLRLVFEEALPVREEGDVVVYELEPDAILRPALAEPAGTVCYGPIIEMGEDYIVQESMYEDGQQVKSTITPETQIWYERPFAVDSGCEALIDADGVALTLCEANG